MQTQFHPVGHVVVPISGSIYVEFSGELLAFLLQTSQDLAGGVCHVPSYIGICKQNIEKVSKSTYNDDSCIVSNSTTYVA